MSEHVHSHEPVAAHHKPKKKLGYREGDGGFWAATAAFAMLLLFFFMLTQAGTHIYELPLVAKEVWLVLIIFLDFYANYRKVRYHDYSIRHSFTIVFRWFSLIFAVPGLLYYVITSHF